MSTSELDRRTFLALGAGVLGVVAAPAWMRPRERLVRLTLPVMGTVAELAVPARHEGMARQALSAAGGELRRIERLMTRFARESDVGRFNGARTGTRVTVAPETVDVVRAALEWAEATEGGFDPTLERLVVLWDPGHVGRPPDADALQAARGDAGGWRTWIGTGAGVDGGGAGGSGTIVKMPATSLDLGGIAKGYGVDRAAQVLREHGIHRGLVNVGGDLMALGDGPGGRPWKVGIRDPANPSGTLRTLELTEAAVATSGDYLRFFDHDGRRYHHILDPRTGAPVRSPLRTVTVVAADAMTADASATAVYAMGVERGGAVLATRPGGPRIAHSG